MATKINVEFPDGNKKEFDKGVNAIDIANTISEGLARATLAYEFNGELRDTTAPITTDGQIRFITFKDDEGKTIFHHSSAHLVAHAAKELWPEIKLTIGPAIENGFYYDFDTKENFGPEHIEKLEAKMKELVKQNIPFVREDVSKDKAIEYMKARKETYKIDMINDLPEGEKISMYHQGDNFVDLCRGPHVPSSKYIKSFKLTKTSGAYWKGDAKNKMLQRVYGVSFPDKKDLKAYLHMMEEAERRDHRKIGKEMNLFSFQDEAPGMPFFHNKGTHIWNKLVEFMTENMKLRDYEIVKAPIILNEALWRQSGHWDHYQENMYFTKIDEADFAVKPMNCPGHMLIFRDKMWSYRDMPLRMGEFGLVHRHELSGVLSGLFRVRMFTQDDAHVFCTQEQIKDEVKNLIDFTDMVYNTFGFEYHMELSTRPAKAMGDPKQWEVAEKILAEVLKESGREFRVNEGDGAFYGPKIDFHLKDAIGRTWQCGTIQLDFQMPEKFDLNYEGDDGQKHRPVMLHRAILGSVERFMGMLVEHYAGKFPLWINPNQIKVLPIADRHIDYAYELKKRFKQEGFSVEVDNRSESIKKKVRNAQLEQYNYILVVGDNEAEKHTVTPRTRDNVVEETVSVDDFVKRVKAQIADKK